MTYRVLDTIVLDRDVPEHGLRKGDLGAVVEVYEGDGLEIEFVTASGRTAALLTLSASDVRPVADDDLVSVRNVQSPGLNDQLRAEYQRSDFGPLVRGKYARRVAEAKNLVVLDPRVAKAFPNDRAVNKALKELLRQRKAQSTKRPSRTRRTRRAG
jgi:hypothetical protein